MIAAVYGSQKRLPVFTIFTPTYNRAYTLPTLYESLKQQTRVLSGMWWKMP